MDLFTDPRANILPRDGTVNYYGAVVSKARADELFNLFYENIPWKQGQAEVLGKIIIMKRKYAWFGEDDFCDAMPELCEMKKLVEKISNSQFNACLFNLYPDGSQGINWHSDNESALGKNPSIASLSFGAERKFALKHKITQDKVSVDLESGDLLVMKGQTQRWWLHSVPKSALVKEPRINLTFRRILK